MKELTEFVKDELYITNCKKSSINKKDTNQLCDNYFTYFGIGFIITFILSFVLYVDIFHDYTSKILYSIFMGLLFMIYGVNRSYYRFICKLCNKYKKYEI